MFCLKTIFPLMLNQVIKFFVHDVELEKRELLRSKIFLEPMKMLLSIRERVIFDDDFSFFSVKSIDCLLNENIMILLARDVFSQIYIFLWKFSHVKLLYWLFPDECLGIFSSDKHTKGRKKNKKNDERSFSRIKFTFLKLNLKKHFYWHLGFYKLDDRWNRKVLLPEKNNGAWEL